MAYLTAAQLEHDWAEGEWSGHHSNRHCLALAEVVVHWLHGEQHVSEPVVVDEGGVAELRNCVVAELAAADRMGWW